MIHTNLSHLEEVLTLIIIKEKEKKSKTILAKVKYYESISGNYLRSKKKTMRNFAKKYIYGFSWELFFKNITFGYFDFLLNLSY